MPVTILIPVYNVEKYIAECARSLFAQSYKDIKYIFCDDCTPDNSIEILKDVLKSFPSRSDSVRIIKNKRNLGLGGTRANLVREVATDYFMIVDSDDVLPEDAVNTLVKAIHETNTDIVEGAYARLCGGDIGKIQPPFHGSERDYRRKLLCQNELSQSVWGKIYKSSILSKFDNLFYEGIDMAEDFCATAKLADVCTRAAIDDLVYLYRVDNGGSYTKNITEKNILSYCNACYKVLSYYQNKKGTSLDLEIGILNAYRQARISNVALHKVHAIINLSPAFPQTRLILRMFRGSEVMFRLSNLLYKLTRFIVAR